ncbi:MAG: hypothetical protein IRY94_06365 [Rhodospirillaceae bacterium]|nr:hypothetical protein [Rhodospirillaceae bacterium]
MIIDGKITEGYVLLCDRCDEAFLAKRLGPSVECPRCGRTEVPARLMTEYLSRQPAEAASAEAPSLSGP